MSTGAIANPPSAAFAFPAELDLTLISRRPARLTEQAEQALLQAPVPVAPLDGREQAAPPRVSIVIVTHNQLPFTKLCLGSLLANTRRPDPPYEVIVVDNASTDGTCEYLRAVAAANPHVRAEFNDTNRGFAPANNQGLALAAGEVLVLLNNDTAVTTGWLAGLLRHLDQPGVGAVGPVTNRIGNEAEVETSYLTYAEFANFAQRNARERGGEAFDIPTLCMFCLALPRNVLERVGPLDEQFEGGMFEDDDYSVRLRAAGYRVACAADVFVHHFGQASFGGLVPSGRYMQLFQANRERFERKWDVQWKPHARRPSAGYAALVREVRVAVDREIPPGVSVLVVSRGDESLLELGSRRARHFPQDNGGGFAGHNPVDSADAIAHLEALRSSGAEFLVFPNTALWWLEHYSGFRRYLDEGYRRICNDRDSCVIFDLTRPSPAGG